ncbi:substrate-binding periplasmic protein [Roseateles cellulosilyticus]|uniref:Transporter substrate-binding domain-containing protein n=1 Tax=Pelomonas cellulosilytica TaxID=2906762 RepID=A0ABS8XU47_9BURK|nr:transporter substrate-binding domain-containing protein [Pelomonas sp. P8]MCE4554219.1 transporter substrate-binding domain-containing protein [Pelomonas sp. P8]
MKRRPLLLMLVAAPALRAAGAPLIYPMHDPGRESHWRYLLALMKLATEHAGVDYEFIEAREPMSQARVIRELSNRTGSLDLAWTMTSIEREAQMIPVRVPVDRGLIGHRICLVRREHADRWAGLRTLDQLKRYKACQGADWPDYEILRHNGLPVEGASRYEALFDMLRKGRSDYFPRAVFEIEDEAAGALAEGLVIEPNVLIRYPTASYLFVRPDRPELAADLERGLEAAVADGSFQRLFQRYFGDLIARHRLVQRTVITLRNPLLPPATPLGRPGYWLVL